MVSNSLNPHQWINSYAHALYRYSLRRVNDSRLAEDLVQETFLSAWKARDNFRGEASEKNWLFKICKNKIIDYYRRSDRYIIQLFPENEWTDLLFDDTDNRQNEKQPENRVVDYQRIVETKEFYVVFDKCLKGLKQKQHAAFALRYLDDLEAEDICRMLGVSPSNYWVLIHRAKLQLCGCMRKNWIDLQ